MNKAPQTNAKSPPRVAVVMPAYNVAGVVAQAIAALPPHCVDEIFVVDDGSHDGTGKVAAEAGGTVITHTTNKGYGGAQKSGYKAAIESNSDIVVLVHGDNQYDPSFAELFIAKIRDEGFDVVTGTRMVLGDALSNNMPIWKYIPIRATTWLQNLMLGTSISDYHDGYRAYSGSFLRSVPLDQLSNRFDFDFDMMIQAAVKKSRIAEIPHPTRYGKEHSQLPFGKAVACQLTIFKSAFKFLLHRLGLMRQDTYERRA
ncbi:glycosyltransferase [Prosthecobacter vanneervenii]|uniref:glycosyltransferase n=1 Tax=Prosthecobacter vanneervenii TaxID=48466 RepID=UPI001621538A|nr:glycosyltransferase family 2 protein [Prosthecobacter vanneervenii]